MKSVLTIYHNPRCSKSRNALEIIRDKKLNPEIIEYMYHSVSQKKLKELLMLLNIKPVDLVRKKESFYKENLEGKNFTSAQWIKILSEQPELIERPIIVKGNKALIGRDSELINLFLNE